MKFALPRVLFALPPRFCGRRRFNPRRCIPRFATGVRGVQPCWRAGASTRPTGQGSATSKSHDPLTPNMTSAAALTVGMTWLLLVPTSCAGVGTNRDPRQICDALAIATYRCRESGRPRAQATCRRAAAYRTPRWRRTRRTGDLTVAAADARGGNVDVQAAGSAADSLRPTPDSWTAPRRRRSDMAGVNVLRVVRWPCDRAGVRLDGSR
jgi:hypothetical protein